MKIISWNVNGLSACLDGGYLRFLEHSDADVICFQETKGRPRMDTPGYLQYWNPAVRKGYSGTAVLTRHEPLSVQRGIGVERFDREGRAITLEYDSFYLINVYVPNSQRSAERANYRAEWDEAFRLYVQDLRKPLIIAGDFNVTRGPLDIYEENEKMREEPENFLSRERDGMERLLALGLVDVYRARFPVKRSYTWWSARKDKRSQDRGWRLDYFLVSRVLLDGVTEVKHMNNLFGSDHCPITMSLYVPEKKINETVERLAQMWREFDWERARRKLAALQADLTRAAIRRKMPEVRALQNEIIHSLEARALAVKKVAKTNSVSGVDSIRLDPDDDASKMGVTLSLTPPPLSRDTIPANYSQGRKWTDTLHRGSHAL